MNLCLCPLPAGAAVPFRALCDRDGGDAVPESGPTPAALCPSSYLLPGFQFPQVSSVSSRVNSSSPESQTGSVFSPQHSEHRGVLSETVFREKPYSESMLLQPKLALELKSGDLYLGSFRESHPYLMTGGGRLEVNLASFLGCPWCSALCQTPGDLTLFLSLKRLHIASQN